MRRLFLLAFVFLQAVLLCAAGPARQIPPRPGPIPAQQPAQPPLPSGVQADWWSQVQADIQKEEYNISWKDETVLPGLKGAWQAPNRAQGFRTCFTEEGIRVVPLAEGEPSWEWGLSLVEQAAGDRRQKERGRIRGSGRRRTGSNSIGAGSRNGM
jgi:hypothetical protein